MKPHIETLPLEQLRPAEMQARMMTPEQQNKLRRSIETYGCVELIVFNRRSGRVVSGHQRLAALRELGETETRCVVVDLDEDNERALYLALNKIGGAWDEAKLREALQSFSADFDATLSGFDMDEIHELMTRDIVPQQDDFDAEAAYEETAEPITKPGDLWQLGEHRLLCGDSTIASDIVRLMDGEQAQLIVTDPPYNVNYHSKAGSIQNDNMKARDFAAFLRSAFKNMLAVAMPGAAAYVFYAYATGVVFEQEFQAAGWNIAQRLVWIKNHFSLGRLHYHNKHEPVIYGHKPGGKVYFIDDRTQHTALELLREDLTKMKKAQLLELLEQYRAAEDAALTTALRADKPLRSDEHPTMKPIPLLGQLIRNSSKPGWLVLDPFAGSGSTLIACEQLQRRARCVEIDPRYCDVVIRRWEAATGRTAERIA